ncbi:MAG: NnrS family protein [Campylobacterales bacterium]|nr:NnrS family protein [Campylobacterales bacterium]
MEFSTSPNFQQPEPPKLTKVQYFFSQPHQSFFILGIVTAIISMIIFGLMFKGVVSSSISPKLFHTYTLFFPTFLSFFVGFLFTTFPRFSATEPIKQESYNRIFFLLLLSTIAFFIGVVFNESLMVAGVVTFLLGQILAQYQLMKIYKISQALQKSDQFWILIGFTFGTISHILFLLSFIGIHSLENLAISLGFFNFLIFIAFSVAQRMIPFFSHLIIDKNPKVLASLAILFLLRSLLIEYGYIFEILAGVLLTLEIKRWKMIFFSSHSIVWILQLAILWLPIGLIIGGLSSMAEKFTDLSLLYLNIHLVALGFLMTVLIGFGTRVALGHSENQMVIDSFTEKLFYFTQVVVILRVLVSFSDLIGTNLMILFDISMFSWGVLFGVWSYKFFGVIAFGKKMS